jgi:hypothetical protein
MLQLLVEPLFFDINPGVGSFAPVAASTAVTFTHAKTPFWKIRH